MFYKDSHFQHRQKRLLQNILSKRIGDIVELYHSRAVRVPILFQDELWFLRCYKKKGDDAIEDIISSYIYNYFFAARA